MLIGGTVPRKKTPFFMQIPCSPLHQCWALEWYSFIFYQTEQRIQSVMHLQQSEIILSSKRKACHWSFVWTNFMHTYLVTTSSCAQTTSPGWPCLTNIVLPMNCSTDHSPQASARIQWWLLQLSAYEYTLKFRDTFSHSNADVLSHLLMPVAPPKAEPPPEVVLLMEHPYTSPLMRKEFEQWLSNTLSSIKFFNMFKRAWPRKEAVTQVMAPFYGKRVVSAGWLPIVEFKSYCTILTLSRDFVRTSSCTPGDVKDKSIGSHVCVVARYRWRDQESCEIMPWMPSLSVFATPCSSSFLAVANNKTMG